MALGSNKSMYYDERCRTLDIQKLEDRSELIQFFKISKGMDEVSWLNGHIVVPPRADKRAQIRREIVKSCNQRHQFFTNRIVNDWNELPNELVDVRTVEVFKKKLDDWIVEKRAAFKNT